MGFIRISSKRLFGVKLERMVRIGGSGDMLSSLLPLSCDFLHSGAHIQSYLHVKNEVGD